MPEKTPEEIKEDLAAFGVGVRIDFGNGEFVPPLPKYMLNSVRFADVCRDALSYIQQLEEDNAKKHEKIMQLYIALEDMKGIVQSIAQDSKTTFQQLETKCHQLERERDALLKDIESVQGCICIICKNYNNPNPGTGTAECNILGRFKDRGSDGALMCGQFKWRGVKEE